MDPLLSPSKRRGPISAGAAGAAAGGAAAAARPRAAAGAGAPAAPSGFSLMVTGQIESAEVRRGRRRGFARARVRARGRAADRARCSRPAFVNCHR